VRLISTLLLLCGARPLCADQVEMQNGDRYFGRVLSLNSDTLALQSEILGVLHLQRAKMASITFGVSGPTNSATRAVPVASGTPAPLTNGPGPFRGSPATNANAELARALRQLPSSTNLVQQVERQFLTDADPKAREKFTEMLGGLMTGKLSVGDIRAEAQSAAEQLRSLKRDLGDDAGFAVDGYLSILDHFLKETPAPAGRVTNAAARTKNP
jgi:hypothetical protein